MGRELLEISDLIVDYDISTLSRRPVLRDAAAKRLADNRQGWAARFVSRLPANGRGELEPEVCDGILVRSHTELQRLSEEFLQADRARSILVPLLEALRGSGEKPPYRIVDVGCGLGYVVRALAAHGRLGRDVELLGCDMNRALIEQAQRLTTEESLPCEFRVANAFTLAEPAHVFITTGVVHHFRGAALDAFFEGQKHARAFAHFDMQPSVLSPLGSWIFHQARMREPLARHDGVVSAARAHTSATLLSAARKHTSLSCMSFDESKSLMSVMLRPMHAVLGVSGELRMPFVERLGPLAARLGATS